MDAGKLVTLAITLLLGGYILMEFADALAQNNPSFGPIATAIISAFLVGALAKLRRG
jgi:hypothetical protein